MSELQVHRLVGKLVPQKSLKGLLKSQITLTGKIALLVDFDDYKGLYYVIPDAKEQILDTSDKVATEDIYIAPIPTFEVSNDAGGNTFIIGR